MQFSKKDYETAPLRFFSGISPVMIEYLSKELGLDTSEANFINLQGGIIEAINTKIYKEPISHGIVSKFDKKELGIQDDQPEREAGINIGIKGPTPGMGGPSM